MLRRAYGSVFTVARAQGGIRTIAFPAISSGVYGYPKRAAAKIALEAMTRHRADFDRVIACVFSEGDAAIYRELLVG